MTYSAIPSILQELRYSHRLMHVRKARTEAKATEPAALFTPKYISMRQTLLGIIARVEREIHSPPSRSPCIASSRHTVLECNTSYSK